MTVWCTGCYLVGWREEFDARGTNGREASHRVHLTFSPEEMGRQAGAKGEFIAPQSRDYPYAGAATNVAAASPTAAAEAARANAVAAQKEMEEDLVAASKKRADDLVAERKRILAANEGKQPKRQEPQTVTSPVTAAVADPKMIDPTTGKPTIYHGENFKVSAEYGYIAFEMFMEQAHPVLKARIKGQEDLIASGWKPENERSGDNPGAHAEIVAVNKALMAREAAKLKVDDSSIEELYLHNRWLLRGQYPDGAAKMCSHCKRILSGINTIGHE